MTVKRLLDEDIYVQPEKRFRGGEGPASWPFDCADLSLGQADLSLQADHFLRRIGVCSGVHAASDDSMSSQYGFRSAMASYSSWQGLSEQAWWVSCSVRSFRFSSPKQVAAGTLISLQQSLQAASSCQRGFTVCRRCCAELNILLHTFKDKFSEVPLHSYHSWTRACKAVTYARLQQHFEQLPQPGAQMQLEMMAHLLDSIVRELPEAAICKYTFNLTTVCPAWLRSWCLRWGFTSGSVSVLCLDSFCECAPKLAGYDFLGYPVHVNKSDQAATTLYVPCIS